MEKRKHPNMELTPQKMTKHPKNECNAAPPQKRRVIEGPGIYIYAGRRTILEANETSTFWPLGGVARASGAGAEYHTTGSTGVGGVAQGGCGWLRMEVPVFFGGGSPLFGW